MNTEYEESYVRYYKGRSLIEFPDTYTIVDIETTGFDPKFDDIIEIAAVKVVDNVVTDTFQIFVKPKNTISDFITNLTGISNDMIEKAPEKQFAVQQFIDFVGDDIIVGHNVNFDINFIYDCAISFNYAFSNNFVDTLRIARKFVREINNHKLSSLAAYFEIEQDMAHRALNDCYVTNSIYMALRNISPMPIKTSVDFSSMEFDTSNMFYGKKITVSGEFREFGFENFKIICDKCGAILLDAFYKYADCYVMGEVTYSKYLRGDYSEKMEKAIDLAKKRDFLIISEEQFYKSLNIDIPQKKPRKSMFDSHKPVFATTTDIDETNAFFGKVCVFTGTLEKMNRNDAMQIIVNLGGICGNTVTSKTNYLVMGNNDYSALNGNKSSKQLKAEDIILKGGDIEIITENVFYEMISENGCEL